jgi:hypothetical protein
MNTQDTSTAQTSLKARQAAVMQEVKEGHIRQRRLSIQQKKLSLAMTIAHAEQKRIQNSKKLHGTHRIMTSSMVPNVRGLMNLYFTGNQNNNTPNKVQSKSNQNNINNTTATGMKVSMRAYGGTLPATVGTAAGTGAELDSSPSIAVTVPSSGADLGFCVITYTIGTANPMAAGKYALELSGLQWTDSVITPGTTAAPSAGLANVTLESNAEAAKLVLVNLWPADSTNMKQVRIFDTTAYGGLATFLTCRKISTESPQLSPNYTGTATTFSMTIMLTNDLAAGDIFFC